jgi:hypothetical protein
VRASANAARLHLVGVDLDAGSKRRLEQVRIGRCHEVPAQRVEIGGEVLGIVEALRTELLPASGLDDPTVGLVVPKDFELLPLRIVLRTGELDDRGCPLVRTDVLDKPAPRTDLDQVARFREALGERLDSLTRAANRH